MNVEEIEKMKKEAEAYLKKEGLTDKYDYITTPMGIIFIPKGTKEKYFESFGNA